MINRINLILKAKNITARQFAEEIGIQPSGMSHILGGRNNPSLEFVSKVIRRYPEIDANWLLMGRGEMYTSGRPATVSATPTEPPVVDELPQVAAPTLFAFGEETAADWMQPTAPREEPREEMPVPPMPPEEEPADMPEEVAPVEKVVATRVPTERKVERILFIYSDKTFEEYRPRG